MNPIVVSIAGSDSSAGAGIQADLKAITAAGGYGATVLTAITAQNTQGVQAAADLDVALIRAQIAAVFDDLDVAAVKTGMLSSAEIVRAVADELAARRPAHYVCDPVMISKTGFPLLQDDAVEAVRTALLPLAELVTPNVHEAERLTGRTVKTSADAVAAGEQLLAAGARAVLIKGGHLEAAPGLDVLVSADGVREFPGEWVRTKHTHGTGCTYSALLATELAHGRELGDAIRRAKDFLTQAIAAGWAVGRGVGPTNPFFFLTERSAR